MAPSFYLNTKIIHKSALSTSCSFIGVDRGTCRSNCRTVGVGESISKNIKMNSSNSTDLQHHHSGARGLGSLHSDSISSVLLARSSCISSGGLPVTPDSVVGTNILLQVDRLHSRQLASRGCTATMAQPPSPASSSASTSSSLSSATSTPSLSFIDATSNDEVDDGSLAFNKLLLSNILTAELDPHYHVAPDYLHSSALISPTPLESKDQGVSERCRRRTCEWMYDICDHFQLQREVVGIALFYVDRYFTITFEGAGSKWEATTSSGQQRQVPVTRREFQLVALTGLYIAVKLHGASRPRSSSNPNGSQQTLVSGDHASGCSSELQLQEEEQQFHRLRFSISVCASISRNQFTSHEIEQYELKILNTLHWHVNPIVSSGSVIDMLLMHLPSFTSSSSSMTSSHQQNGGCSMDNDCLSVYVYDCAKYLAELSVSVPALCMVYKPSILAYSSILYALETVLFATTTDVTTTSFKLSSSSSSSSSSKPYSLCSHADACLQEYEMRVRNVSSNYFGREREHVESSKKILQTICPNLGDLFMPSQSMMMTSSLTSVMGSSPTSPTSVKSV